MGTPDRYRFTRRNFITSTSALSAASLLGISSRAAADPLPETTRLRLAKWPVSCIAPQFVAEALLRAEGFTDVQYVEATYPEAGEPYFGFVGPGKADFDTDTGESIMRDVRYVWRIYNPEDTLRFYGLRLHDVGMIKSPPQKLIAQGTDWRFLNELKRELKA